MDDPLIKDSENSQARLCNSLDEVIRPHSALSNFTNGTTSVSVRRQKLLSKRRPRSSLGNEASKSVVFIPAVVPNNEKDPKYGNENYATTKNQKVWRKQRPSLKTSDDCESERQLTSSKHESLLVTTHPIASFTTEKNKLLHSPSTSKVSWRKRQQYRNLRNGTDAKLLGHSQSRLTADGCKTFAKPTIPRFAVTLDSSQRLGSDISSASDTQRTSPSSSRGTSRIKNQW